MQDLKVTLIQSDLKWEDKSANLKNFKNKITNIKEDTDLIILPEMFTTGFSMNPKALAEAENDETLAWMQARAKEKNAFLTASFIVIEKEKYYNRLFLVSPNGDFKTYNKRHLFRMAGEDNFYTMGEDKFIAEIKGWKINFLICYDLRFPVWTKNTYANGAYEYDILLTIASWPEVRSHIWTTLLAARAIENQAFAVGVNRVGDDIHMFHHSGNSNIFDAKGIPLLNDRPSVEFVETIALQYNKLKDLRDKINLGLDWDNFTL